jgi:hypothetical protein
MNRREFVQGVAGATAVGGALPAMAAGATTQRIELVMDRSAGSAATVAVRSVESACTAKKIALTRRDGVPGRPSGMLVVVGCADESSTARQMCVRFGASVPQKAESFVIRQGTGADGGTLVLCAHDSLGLAYALYALTDAIACGNDVAGAIASLRDANEAPAVRDRSLSMYTMQQAYFESRLFDERFWDAYLNNMVRHRFNNFSLLFAYESSGYLAPPYPWLFDMPEFPEVKADGVTADDQQRYLKALNRVIAMTHERGLKFTLGIWDHIYDGHSSYYTKGVWDHLPAVNGRKPRWPVEELTVENLVAYTPRALKRFLELVPHLDGIQFRMHGESGLTQAGLKNFWAPVFRVMAATKPKIRFDARAKEFPMDLAYTALEMGVDLRLTTKYCAEQVGTPFHGMHIQPVDQFGTRTSYFDMLRYPKRYPVQWRLWTSGTLRVLSWGGLEYARRFAETMHLYDGDGFEVAEPLATKMASEPHDKPPTALLNESYRYYKYEFERYWPYFFAFGRGGYGLAQDDEAWRQLFKLHFGRSAAPHVQQALEKASEILPRIVAYSFPLSKFPTTRGWPERQRWEDLPEYAAALPNDVGLFASFDEETAMTLGGGTTAKVRLEETRAWFEGGAAEVLREAADAERVAPKPLSKEMTCMLVDLRILAGLAKYHERRIEAGRAYSLYRVSGDLFALDDAIAREREAITAWRGIVEAAGDVYARELAMGLQIAATPTHEAGDLSGHWRDELPLLEAGWKRLVAERESFAGARRFVASYILDANSAEANEILLPHKRSFSVDVPVGEYVLEFEVRQDFNRDDRIFGPMWIEANGLSRTPAFVVPAGKMVTQTLTTQVRDGRLGVLLGNESTSEAILIRMRVFRIEATLAHAPLRRVSEGKELELRATVSAHSLVQTVEAVWTDSSGVQSVHTMNAAGMNRYSVLLNSTLAGAGGNYFLRAVESTGELLRYPTEGTIQVTRMQPEIAPEFTHVPVHSARAGVVLRITAQVRSAHGLLSVRLRYRGVTQFQDYACVEMMKGSHEGEFMAEIPAKDVSSEWDLMYFFEVFDQAGRGWILPNAQVETPYVVVELDRSTS